MKKDYIGCKSLKETQCKKIVKLNQNDRKNFLLLLKLKITFAVVIFISAIIGLWSISHYKHKDNLPIIYSENTINNNILQTQPKEKWKYITELDNPQTTIPTISTNFSVDSNIKPQYN
ncbi:hypothetical protein HHS_01070 [Candidatus Pantoea carbekii]|uniref:Uncharacterized protein n=1 Tax=Candidatus Pantoea carbekii TaxID=1235990 RepID=U3U6V8_9GAMM|nr:hypothetical protein HHS_01070 [Candidatus Pantoea carbekii]